MKPRHKKLAAIALGVAGLGLAVGLVLSAFQKNLVFYFTPSQVVAKEAPVGHSFRIGGLVKKGSLKRDGVTVHFIVTDTVHSMPVEYHGQLPDLFKEGKGVVAQGKLTPSGLFVASEVLAKHDANYMPPAAADAIKQARAESRAPESTSTLAATGGEGGR